MISQRLTLALPLLAVALSAGTAAASQHFPIVIKSKFGLAQAPGCVLCHQTDRGGENTVTQPFGITMLRFGAEKKKDGTLVSALDRADAEGTDSDGDCVADIDELVAQPPTNPNVPDQADGGHCAIPENPPPLRTGCTIAQRRDSDAVTILLGVCVIFLTRRTLGKNRVARRMNGAGR